MSYVQFLQADRAALRTNNVSPPAGYSGLVGPLVIEAEDTVYWSSPRWDTDNASPALFRPGAGQTAGAGAAGGAAFNHTLVRNVWTSRISALAPQHPTLGVLAMRVLRNSDGALVMAISFNQQGSAATSGGTNGTTPQLDTDNHANGPLPYDDYRVEFIAVSGTADLDKVIIG